MSDDCDIDGAYRRTVSALKELLRVEYELHNRVYAPWKCNDLECPRFSKAMSRDCRCFVDKRGAHLNAVRRELGV